MYLKLLSGLLAFACSLTLAAQEPIQATLLYNWNDSINIPMNNWPGSRYNEVWGFELDGHEYAVIGSTLGMHFFDVTEPANTQPLEHAFVGGASQGVGHIHRDMKHYRHYLYVVADQGPSTLQVIDLSGLPDATSLTYDSDEHVIRAHNLYIDTLHARLYTCGVTASGQGYSVRVFSLDNPAEPELLPHFSQFEIPYVHDLFVEDHIGYLNCGNAGLYVVDFSNLLDVQLLGTLSDYVQAGYNHSGWMHETEPIYYMADETHGRDMKVVDVSDFTNLTVDTVFNGGASFPSHIVHNLLVRGNYLYTSYYYEGLQVFDLSNPWRPRRAYYYNTFPGPGGNSYKGAWGVYPMLPSGTILVSDMQGGLFVFEAIDGDQVSSNTEVQALSPNWSVQPNPATEQVTVQLHWPREAGDAQLRWIDLQGRMLGAETRINLLPGAQTLTLNTPQAANGLVFLQLRSGQQVWTQRVILNR
jgi:choice-of-anchor B domain-containing protein